MQSLERFAVIQTAKSVLRAELMRMTQSNDEPIRTFSARVQGKAQTCGFLTSHTCTEHTCRVEQKVDYTMDVIKDVVLAGIGDPEIRTSVLDCDGIEEKTLNDIISLIERKEKSRKAYSTAASISNISSFRRQQHQPAISPSSHKQQTPPSPSPKIPCPRCRRSFQTFNGRNIKPFECCLHCFRSLRNAKKRDNYPSALASSSIDEEVVLLQKTSIGNDTVSNCGLSVSEQKRLVNKGDTLQLMGPDNPNPTPNCTHVSVSAVSSRPHPKLNLRLKRVGGHQMVPFIGIADTGAQINIWGLADYLGAGFQEAMLQKPSVKVSAVNQIKLNITGGFVAEIEGEDCKGEIVSCRAMVQVSNSVSGFYIS